MNSFPAPTLVGSAARESRSPSALQRPHGAKIGVADRRQRDKLCLKWWWGGPNEAGWQLRQEKGPHITKVITLQNQ